MAMKIDDVEAKVQAAFDGAFKTGPTGRFLDVALLKQRIVDLVCQTMIDTREACAKIEEATVAEKVRPPVEEVAAEIRLEGI
jgi:hypothetical protein